jgi:hypothetical protein
MALSLSRFEESFLERETELDEHALLAIAAAAPRGAYVT